MKKQHRTAQIISMGFLVGVILGSIGFTVWKNSIDKEVPTSSYDSCVTQKDSILQESYPDVCVTRDGQRFVNPNQRLD